MEYYFPGRGLMQYAMNSEAPSPAPVPVPNNSEQNVVYAEPIHSREPCTRDIASLARENEELKHRISQLETKVDQLMKWGNQSSNPTLLVHPSARSASPSDLLDLWHQGSPPPFFRSSRPPES